MATKSRNNSDLDSVPAPIFLEIAARDWCGEIFKTSIIPIDRFNKDVSTLKFWEEWYSACCWYLIVGGSRAMHKMKIKLDNLNKKIRELHLEAQTKTILDQISTLERESRLVQDHMQFLKVTQNKYVEISKVLKEVNGSFYVIIIKILCTLIKFLLQKGFVQHGVDFHRNGKPISPSPDFRIEQTSTTDQDIIEITAQRVGLGSGVHLWVTVYNKRDPSSPLDQFQAYFPCVFDPATDPTGGWHTSDYADLTIGDLALSLQNAYLDRHPEHFSFAKPSARAYGRWLSSVEAGRDVFVQPSPPDPVHGEPALLSERLDLFLDLRPSHPSAPLSTSGPPEVDSGLGAEEGS